MQNARQESALSTDFQLFFEESPVPAWIYDNKSLQFVAVNQAAVKKYGYSRAEFLQMSINDIRPEEDRADFKNYMASDFRERQNARRPWRHTNKNGSIFFVEVYCRQLPSINCEHTMVQAIDVSDKVLSEEENKTLSALARKQKEQLDEILSSVKEVIWAVRVDTFQLLYVNHSCIDVFGYTVEEMIGDKDLFLASIHADDLPKFHRSVDTAITTGYSSAEFRVFHKDGTEKTVTAYARLKKGKNGEPDMLSGSTVDITHQVYMENALRDKIDEVESILDSITDAFFTLDRDGNITYVNKALENVFGINKDRTIGKSLWKAFPDVLDMHFATEYAQVLEYDEPARFEDYFPLLQRWFSISIYPKKDGVAVYCHDITEEREMQQRLMNEEQNLRSLINNTRDMIWSIDRERKVITANEPFRKMILMRYGVPVITGHTIPSHNIEQKNMDEWSSYYNRVFAGESFSTVNDELIQGVRVYFRVSFNPIFDHKNTVIGVSCFATDVTEQRTRLVKMQLQNERLKEIAWVQSHKVRSPVASILGLAELFNNENPADPLNADVIAGVKTASAALDEVIREINDLTQMSNDSSTFG